MGPKGEKEKEKIQCADKDDSWLQAGIFISNQEPADIPARTSKLSSPAVLLNNHKPVKQRVQCTCRGLSCFALTAGISGALSSMYFKGPLYMMHV